jgi:NAD(P)-dependent dehydrogenase (short-subunit alcohol dehydrogenase family)
MVLDKFSLKGQVGIVTGGSQGLGRAFSLAYAEAGADVVVADINEEQGRETIEAIQKLGRRAMFIKTDVSKKASIDAMVSKTVADFGRLDFFMNNAGVALWKEAEEATEEEWRRVMDINLNGVYFCCQAAARHMKANGGGRIINIASMSGSIVNVPQPQAAYNVSKAGVIHLTKSLAFEWAPYNIRVNSISPGYMHSPLVSHLFEDPKYGVEWFKATPMKRPGQPEELCPIAVLLASEASSFMTGSDVVVDGGYSII